MACNCRNGSLYDIRNCTADGKCGSCGRLIGNFQIVRSQLSLPFSDRLFRLYRVNCIIAGRKANETPELYDLIQDGSLDPELTGGPGDRMLLRDFPYELLRNAISYVVSLTGSKLIEFMFNVQLSNGLYEMSYVRHTQLTRERFASNKVDLDVMRANVKNSFVGTVNGSSTRRDFFMAVRKLPKDTFCSIYNRLLAGQEGDLKFTHIQRVDNLADNLKIQLATCASRLGTEETRLLVKLVTTIQQYVRDAKQQEKIIIELSTMVDHQHRTLDNIFHGERNNNGNRLLSYLGSAGLQATIRIWDHVNLFPPNTDRLLDHSNIEVSRVLESIYENRNPTQGLVSIILEACTKIPRIGSLEVWTRFSTHVLNHPLGDFFFDGDNNKPWPLNSVQLPNNGAEGVQVRFTYGEGNEAMYTIVNGVRNGQYVVERNGRVEHGENILGREQFVRRNDGHEEIVQHIDERGHIQGTYHSERNVITRAEIRKDQQIETIEYTAVPYYPHYYYSKEYTCVDYIDFNTDPRIVPVVKDGEVVVFKNKWLMEPTIRCVAYLIELKGYKLPELKLYTMESKYRDITNSNDVEMELDADVTKQFFAMFHGVKKMDLMYLKSIEFRPILMCKTLTGLVISNCNNMELLEVITGTFPRLETLGINNCRNLFTIHIGDFHGLCSLEFTNLPNVLTFDYDSGVVDMRIKRDGLSIYLNNRLGAIFHARTNEFE